MSIAHSAAVRTKLSTLRRLIRQHPTIGAHIMRADSGNVFPFDFLALAALNRSYCVGTAFCQLIASKNFLAAAPLVRLQLDNLLRIHAAHCVPNPHSFATAVLKGVQVNQLRDRAGKRLSDRRLVETLGKEYAWVPRLYKHTSGYVHLSDMHIFNALQLKGDEGEFELKVSARDEFIPDEMYLEAIGAFGETTKTLFHYLLGWAVTKDRVAQKRGPGDDAA